MKADHPTPEAYAAAAWLLMCEVPALLAVAEVEAGAEGAFLPSGEPVILFERHVFHRLTGGRFGGARVPGVSAKGALISDQNWGGYGSYPEQHLRLQAAVKLDRQAALKSASYGLFQILGENHKAAGYPELQRFVTAAYRSVDDHLRMLVMFIRHDARLVDAIRSRDWPTFARRYNGPAYRRNRYDEKMAAAYASWKSKLLAATGRWA
jgi:hypothetical protein